MKIHNTNDYKVGDIVEATGGAMNGKYIVTSIVIIGNANMEKLTNECTSSKHTDHKYYLKFAKRRNKW